MYPPTLTVSLAYGRDYKSKKALLEDWHSGKIDFQCHPSRSYLSKTEHEHKALLRQGFTDIKFRYHKMRKCFILPMEKAFT